MVTFVSTFISILIFIIFQILPFALLIVALAAVKRYFIKTKEEIKKEDRADKMASETIKEARRDNNKQKAKENREEFFNKAKKIEKGKRGKKDRTYKKNIFISDKEEDILKAQKDNKTFDNKKYLEKVENEKSEVKKYYAELEEEEKREKIRKMEEENKNKTFDLKETVEDFSEDTLVKAIIYKELLDRPLSLRD
ncbi:hypothetical protein [uncultured Peptoniphilus sp.]|uniref:hypothetical protein n=1 Tax=uncultured Peptoniphilus sp. TaxID=254354 RepID=UPI0028058971|nr:hypothetical protein [uncultured Peptoniphilus sp.]